MVKLVLMAAALLLSPYAAIAAVPGQDGDAPYSLERTLVTTVRSADGHPYRVMVAWPEGKPPVAGWPVLYVLDGEDNFAIAVQTARRLAAAGARSGIEPGLVVAVDSGGLARRVFDYTPATPGYRIPAGAPAAGLASGGADAFLDFLGERLQPLVAGRWPVDADRQTLLGHSFGGLVALHALFTRPALFSRYVAVSPSLWFGDDLVGREERAFSRPADMALSLLIATGGDERGPNGGSGSASEALAARLARKGVAARYLLLNGQSHGTTMLATMGEAVATAFGGQQKR